jgi:hypothetical protein
VGCFDALLEAPFVLTTGLGSSHSVVPSVRESMLVASDQGIWEIGSTGEKDLIHTQRSLDVATHPDRIYILEESKSGERRIRWGSFSAGDSSLRLDHERDAEGVSDLQAWCNGQVLLAADTDLLLWTPEDGTVQVYAKNLPSVRSAHLGPSVDCETSLVLTHDSLIEVSPESQEVLFSGLINPRGVALDPWARTWLVAGEPPILYLAVEGRLELVARYLGDPRSIHFGTEGWLPPDHIFLVDGEGTLDYLKVPPPLASR